MLRGISNTTIIYLLTLVYYLSFINIDLTKYTNLDQPKIELQMLLTSII